MSARKRWKVVLWPSATPWIFDSRVSAYRYVDEIVRDRIEGTTRATLAVVWVKEVGAGWQTYERVNLNDLANSREARG